MHFNCPRAAIMVVLATSSMGATSTIQLKHELIQLKHEFIDPPIAKALTSVPLANQSLYRCDHNEEPCKDKIHKKYSENDNDDDEEEDDDDDNAEDSDHNGHENLDNHGHGDHGQDGASSDQKGADTHDVLDDKGYVNVTPSSVISPHSSGANNMFAHAHIAVGLLSIIIIGFVF